MYSGILRRRTGACFATLLPVFEDVMSKYSFLLRQWNRCKTMIKSQNVAKGVKISSSYKPKCRLTVPISSTKLPVSNNIIF